MLFSSYNYRNFYKQTGEFYFSLVVNKSNLSGYCDIGFSGSEGVLDFRFHNGQIKYPFDQILGSYNSGESVHIEGRIYSGSGVIAAKNKYFNLQMNSGHSFDHWYVNPVNCNVDVALEIVGEKPNVTVNSSGLFASGESILFEFQKEPEKPPFTIFNSGFANVSGFDYSGLTPFNDSGTNFYILTTGLTYSSQDDEGSYPLIFSFDTNFGSLNIPYTIYKYSQQYKRFTVLPSGTGTIIMDKNSYSGFSALGVYKTPSGFQEIDLVVRLSHVSGSGTFIEYAQQVYNVTGGVYISGNSSSGEVITGLLVTTVPASGCYEAYTASGVMSIQVYVSGDFTATGSGIATGYAWDVRSRQPILARAQFKNPSGSLTGIATTGTTGYIGTYYTSGIFTGFVFPLRLPNPEFITNFMGMPYNFDTGYIYNPEERITRLNQDELYPDRATYSNLFLNKGSYKNSFGAYRDEVGLNNFYFFTDFDHGDYQTIPTLDFPTMGFDGLTAPKVIEVLVPWTGLFFDYARPSTGFLAFKSAGSPFSKYSGVMSGSGVRITNRLFTGIANLSAFLESSPTIGQTYYSPPIVVGCNSQQTTGSFTFDSGSNTLDYGLPASAITGTETSGSSILRLLGSGIDVFSHSNPTGSGMRYWLMSTPTGEVILDMSRLVSRYTGVNNSISGNDGFILQGYDFLFNTGIGGLTNAHAPKTWYLDGSNDLSTWDNIDYKVSQAPTSLYVDSYDLAYYRNGSAKFGIGLTSGYKYFRFSFTETQSTGSPDNLPGLLGLRLWGRAFINYTSGLATGNARYGLSVTTETFNVTGTGFASGNFSITPSGDIISGGNHYYYLTGHRPIDSSQVYTIGGIGSSDLKDTAYNFNSNPATSDIFPMISGTGFVTSTYSFNVRSGAIHGSKILHSGTNMGYAKVFESYVPTGNKIRKSEGVIIYSGGRVIGLSPLGGAKTYVTGTTGVSGTYITGFTENSARWTLNTGSDSGVYRYWPLFPTLWSEITGRASQLNRTSGFRKLVQGQFLPNSIWSGDPIFFSGMFNGVTGSGYYASGQFSYSAGTGVTFDYYDRTISGLIILPGSEIFTGTSSANLKLGYVSGFTGQNGRRYYHTLIDSFVPTYSASSGSYLWSNGTGTAVSSSIGLSVDGVSISGYALPITPSTPLSPTPIVSGFDGMILDNSTGASGAWYFAPYIRYSGIFYHTIDLTRPLYIGTGSGYYLQATPTYRFRGFATGLSGYVESGYIYDSPEMLNTVPYVGAYRYLPFAATENTGFKLPTGNTLTGFPPTGQFYNRDIHRNASYPYMLSGGQLYIKIPVTGYPSTVYDFYPNATGGVQQLTGRFSGLSYAKNLSSASQISGYSGDIPISRNPASYTPYDTHGIQVFIGYSENYVLLAPSGAFSILEFSGNVDVSGYRSYINSFTGNFDVRTGNYSAGFNANDFFGLISGTTPIGVSFKENGWFDANKFENIPSGNSIDGQNGGVTIGIAYTGLCSSGYLADLLISGENIESGVIIRISGKG